jgi:hypothetical protein
LGPAAFDLRIALPDEARPALSLAPADDASAQSGALLNAKNPRSPNSETMPGWFGMPGDADLPSTFSIGYVRAWKHQAVAEQYWPASCLATRLRAQPATPTRKP